MDQTGEPAARLVARGHDRFAQSLIGVVGALVGFATLLNGGFSRFGAWRQIVTAILLIIFVKGIETVGLNTARQDTDLWFASYLSSVVGLVIVAFLLFWASRPYLFKRRPREVPVT
jgi:lipopolysaccharide export system permease protein